MDKKLTPFQLNLLTFIAIISAIGYIIIAVYFFPPVLNNLPKAALPAASSTPLYYGIIDIELTFDASKAATILRAWENSNLLDDARKSICIDWWYIAFYSLFLYSFTLIIANKQEGWLRTLGFYQAPMAFVAGFFDVIENLFLLSFFKSPYSLPCFVVQTESFVSLVKWVLIANFASYILLLSLIFLRNLLIKLKHKEDKHGE